MGTLSGVGGRFEHVVFMGPTVPRRPPGLAVDVRSAPLPRMPEGAYDEETFLRSLLLQAGLNLHEYRFETLARRVPACLRALRCTSLAQARLLVRQRPELLAVAIDAVLIGVTEFFRDRRVFAELHGRLSVDVAAAVSGRAGRWAGLTGGGPRVWSVGCSDGAELYSVGSMLAGAGLLDGAELLGTDCREDAIATARRATYAMGPAADAPAAWLGGLERRGAGWAPTAAVRAAARFEVADALRRVTEAPWDVILCRNMAMYLRGEAARALWRRLEGALALGGLLVTGTAERPVGAASLSYVGPCVYRRDRTGVRRRCGDNERDCETASGG